MKGAQVQFLGRELDPACRTQEATCCNLMVKNLPAKAGDTRDSGLTPGLRRFPGVGNGNLLQYSCWKITRTEGPGPYSPMRSPTVRHD